MARLFEEKLDVYDCSTCMFGNFVGEEILCDKKYLTTGKMIETKNISNCICHSNKEIVVFGIGCYDEDVRKHENSCYYCGRMLEISKTETYIKVKKYGREVNKCIICEEKEIY